MENMFNNWISSIPAEIRAEVVAKLQRCVDKDAVLALAEKYHLPMSEEVANAIALFVSDPKLLNEEDMSNIAGGASFLCSKGCQTFYCVTDDGCSGGD